MNPKIIYVLFISILFAFQRINKINSHKLKDQNTFIEEKQTHMKLRYLSNQQQVVLTYKLENAADELKFFSSDGPFSNYLTLLTSMTDLSITKNGSTITTSDLITYLGSSLSRSDNDIITLSMSLTLDSCSNLFKDCTQLTNVKINQISFDSSVSCESMFEGCTNLKTVEITSGCLTNVNSYKNIFKNCENLESFTMGDFYSQAQITSFESAFDGCISLTSISFGNDFQCYNSLKSTKYMFRNCQKLEEINLTNILSMVHLPENTMEEMEGMFFGCSSAKYIEFSTNTYPKYVESLASLFEGCSSLTSVNFGSSFWTDGTILKNMNRMFYGCSSLKEYNHYSHMQTAAVTNMSEMFAGCTSLTSVNLDPSEISFFATSALDFKSMFENCTNLQFVKFPDYVQKISSSAEASALQSTENMFKGCSSLTSIDWTLSLTGSQLTNFANMFEGCTGLNALNFTLFDFNNSFSFIQNNSLTNDSLKLFGTTDCSNIQITLSLQSEDYLIPNNLCINNKCANEAVNKYLNTDNSCQSSCSDTNFRRYYKCYSECPEGSLAYGKECSISCPTGYDEYNTYCICQTTGEYLKVTDSETNTIECVTDCGTDYKPTSDKQCISDSSDIISNCLEYNSTDLTVCSLCETNYFLFENKCLNCSSLAEYCIQCDWTNILKATYCQKCINVQSTLQSNCSSGACQSGGKSCVKCNEDDETLCDKCFTGYKLNEETKQCETFDCTSNTQNCLNCNNSYKINSQCDQCSNNKMDIKSNCIIGTCAFLDSNCVQCDGLLGTSCTKCYPNYILNETSSKCSPFDCKSEIQKCINCYTTQNEEDCLSCNQNNETINYYCDFGECKKTVENCYSCDENDDTKCALCLQNYTLNTDTNTCENGKKTEIEINLFENIKIFKFSNLTSNSTLFSFQLGKIKDDNINISFSSYVEFYINITSPPSSYISETKCKIINLNTSISCQFNINNINKVNETYIQIPSQNISFTVNETNILKNIRRLNSDVTKYKLILDEIKSEYPILIKNCSANEYVTETGECKEYCNSAAGLFSTYENPQECLNSVPENYYLNQEDKFYYPCPELCYSCWTNIELKNGLTDEECKICDLISSNYPSSRNKTYSQCTITDKYINDVDEAAVILELVNFYNYYNQSEDNQIYLESLKDVLNLTSLNIMEIQTKDKTTGIISTNYILFTGDMNEVDLTQFGDKEIVKKKTLQTEEISQLQKEEEFQKQGIDITDINDEFFNDKCYPYESGGVDYTLKTRISDIYSGVSVCGSSCQVDFSQSNTNFTENSTSSIYCKCNLQSILSVPIVKNIKNEKDVIMNELSKINFGIIKCYNLFFDWKYLKKNIGFYFVLAELVIYIITVIVFFKTDKKCLYETWYQRMFETNIPEDGTKPDIMENLPEYPPKKRLTKVNNYYMDTDTPVNTAENINGDIIYVQTKDSNWKRYNRDYESNYDYMTNRISNRRNNVYNHNPNEYNAYQNVRSRSSKSLTQIVPQNKRCSSRSVLYSETVPEENDYESKHKTIHLYTEPIPEKNNENKHKKKHLYTEPVPEENDEEIKNKKLNLNSDDSVPEENEEEIKSKKKELHSESVPEENEDEIKTEKTKKKNENENKKENKKHHHKKHKKSEKNKKKNPTLYKMNVLNDLETNTNLIPYLQETVYCRKKYMHYPYKMVVASNLSINFFSSWFEFCQETEVAVRMIIKRDPFEIQTLNILLFLYSNAGTFFLTAFFYFDSVVEERYENEGRLSYLTTFLTSLYSSLASKVVTFVGNKLYNYMPKYDRAFREAEHRRSLKKYSKNLILLAEVCVGLYISLAFIFMLFFLYYISIFCVTYKGSSTSWFIDGFISMAIAIATNILISFIMSALRVIGIHFKLHYVYNVYLQTVRYYLGAY